jgi:mannose/fructose/N-acetylgalactosamine-specific phosphotransferase system component IIB
MGQITFARVDQRMIHGQITSSVAPSTGANSIILANDAMANDDFLKSISESTGSSGGMTAEVLTVDQTIERWNDNQFGSKKVLLITKDIEDMHKLVSAGLDIKKINLGNIAQKPDSVNVTDEVAVSESQFGLLKEMNDKYEADIFVQPVPSLKRVPFSEVEKKF